MKAEQEARRTELALVLPRITHLVEWARYANTYIDEHNAPPPDTIDRVTREELIESMEELGSLMQRYADSLRSFAEREPSGSDCAPTRSRAPATTALGTLLKFPLHGHAALTPSREGGDHRARPRA